MHSFEELRQEYKKFLFRDYEILFEEDLCRVSFFYEIPGLSGIAENKPFECVGTRSEVLACLKDYIEKGKTSLLTERYREEILGASSKESDLKTILTHLYPEHHVPEKYYRILEAAFIE